MKPGSIVLGVLLLATPALADVEIRNADIAACAPPADQPICLLRIAARQPHVPYSYDPRFAYSRQVIEAIGDDLSGQSRRTMLDNMRLNVEAMTVDRRGLALALEADRRGATPEASLAMLKLAKPSAPILKELPPEAADMVQSMQLGARAGADQAIVSAYAGPDAAPPKARPTEPLARAALSDWDRVHEQLQRIGAPEKDFDSPTLADAHLRLGDVVGALRTDAAMNAPANVRQGWAALHAGRIAEALSAANRQSPKMSGDNYDAIEQAVKLRQAISEAAERAGQAELAANAQASILRMAMAKRAPSKFDTIGLVDADSAMKVFVRDANTKADAELTLKLDASARDYSSLQSVKNALAASRGWLALNEAGKAKALAAFWAPAVVEGRETCHGHPSGDPCWRRKIDRQGVYNDALTLSARVLSVDEMLTLGITPIAGLASDITDGRRLTRLGEYMRAAKTSQDRYDLLWRCAWLGAEEHELAAADACLDLLMRFVPPEPANGRRAAGSEDDTATSSVGARALALAAAYARQGDLANMRRTLGVALDLYRRSPDESHKVASAEDLEAIAIAELRADGRL